MQGVTEEDGESLGEPREVGELVSCVEELLEVGGSGGRTRLA